ncbi:hypothetical protein NPIL_375281 [Nephila pilipes]|uniref:Uncharacterized protein n=1 Tax=Nephila pilipes TaxID=299642 RepID=A0A8X6MVR1_NEPPI|nr:hypothetical protein NPIL_375281 [Nephila pilipes]
MPNIVTPNKASAEWLPLGGSSSKEIKERKKGALKFYEGAESALPPSIPTSLFWPGNESVSPAELILEMATPPQTTPLNRSNKEFTSPICHATMLEYHSEKW